MNWIRNVNVLCISNMRAMIAKLTTKCKFCFIFKAYWNLNTMLYHHKTTKKLFFSSLWLKNIEQVFFVKCMLFHTYHSLNGRFIFFVVKVNKSFFQMYSLWKKETFLPANFYIYNSILNEMNDWTEINDTLQCTKSVFTRF